jgi:hypothetical protein
MKVVFMPQAEEALYEIGVWIESKNTKGSGNRFVNNMIDSIAAFALPNVKYQDCKQAVLRLLHLQCVVIKDWIVAFEINGNVFTVHYILHGSGLK